MPFRQKKDFLIFLQNKRGSTLLIAYFVVLIFIGIGAPFLLMTVNESRATERQRLSVLAFYIAEAGIERGLYDLRQDFVNDASVPSWSDGDVNGYAIGPNTASYYAIPYSSGSLNGGSYTVELKNVSGATDDIWVKATGTISGASHTISVYVRMVSVSPWDYAIFAGSGASGTMVNGNVNIRGSVLILGSGLAAGDMAVDLGGTAELVGNNYNGVPAALKALVPALPTTTYGGETVETLNAVLRVKRGIVGVSGSASVGETNASGNAAKETVDGVFSNDGFGGNQGTNQVYSDNGTANPYDLGDAVAFPSLSTPYSGYATYQEYLRANALVLTNELSNLDPNSNFSYSNANGSIQSDGNGNMTISGIVYVDGNNNFEMNKAGSDKTITYSGTGSLLVTGDVNINVNLLTSGSNSFPTNIMGIMTPNSITFNEASISVMGLFYSENSIVVQKQTNIMGTIVSNYFDVGTNVPSIFQVPATVNYLPPGMVGSQARWYLVVAWIDG